VAGAEVHFVLPMPKSWSDTKRAEMLGQPHQQKPDISNLLKALEDAVVKDDSKIWHYAAQSKTWGEEGSIEIITQEERYQVNAGPAFSPEEFKELVRSYDEKVNP
jgi:Holliday junction resolvase RusA-like endonuclease